MVGLRCARFETQLVLFIAPDEVLNDGARLPKGDASVGVVDGGKPAVGVDSKVLWLLDVRQWDSFSVVRDPEPFETHGYLRRIEAALNPSFDKLELIGHA